MECLVSCARVALLSPTPRTSNWIILSSDCQLAANFSVASSSVVHEIRLLAATCTTRHNRDPFFRLLHSHSSTNWNHLVTIWRYIAVSRVWQFSSSRDRTDRLEKLSSFAKNSLTFNSIFLALRPRIEHWRVQRYCLSAICFSFLYHNSPRSSRLIKNNSARQTVEEGERRREKI